MSDKFAYSCVVCSTVLDGPLGWLFKVFGIRRSARNPNVCNRCDAHLQEGRVVELSILFADLTGFTAMTHRLGADRSYQVVDSFFKMANEILVANDAFIDKYIGDAVMAFFNAPIRHAEHARKAASAAFGIQNGLAALSKELNEDLHARIGVATGYARVGRVGSTDRKDYTAIGDAVNLASRLEAFANPGEIMIDERAFTRIASEYQDLVPETLAVRGFPEPIRAYRLGEACRSEKGRTPFEELFIQERKLSLGTVLLAIFGAPCAAVTVLSPLALFLGVGSALGAIAPVLGVLESASVRIPLHLLVVSGAAINLYVIRKGTQRRAAAGFEELTRSESRKVSTVAALSVVSLLVVAFEIYAHVYLEGHPYF